MTKIIERLPKKEKQVPIQVEVDESLKTALMEANKELGISMRDFFIASATAFLAEAKDKKSKSK